MKQLNLSRRGKIFISFLVVMLAVASGIGFFVYQTVRDLPDIGDVKSIIKNQTTYIYAKDGTLITRLFRENRTVVPISKISTTMQQAIISVEDQRFYDHRGVDYIRIVGALVRDIKDSDSLQGGSTITQQYVKNAYFSPEQTVQRKIREAFLATKLERNYSKREILEKYLNSIYFGNGAYGVEAASQTYFGIPAGKLNVEQSALLSGVIKGPTIYNPYKNPTAAIKRRNLVISLMEEQGYVTKTVADAAREHPLSLIPKQQQYTGIAPYYVEWIKAELDKIDFDETAIYSQGLKIYTTLDPKLQENAENAWKKYLPKSTDPDVAIVVIDPKTGAVKAMIGGKNFANQKMNLAAQGDGRQPGSSFKPIVFAAALMSGVSPDDGFNASSPQTIKLNGGKPWVVHNYSGESGAGIISLKKAMAKSVNVVFANLIDKVGAEKVVDVAHKLGIKTDIDANLAIALGGVNPGVKPIEMATVYATFANNGTYNEPYGVDKIEMPSGDVIYKQKSEPVQAVDKAVAYLVTESLKGVVQGGTGTRARIGRPAAGKTGTTQKYADAWFCGYTPDLAAAVWVGHKDGQTPMTNVHGIRVAGGTFPAQIWAALMKKAHSNIPKHDFENAPKGSLTYISLCSETNLRATEYCPHVTKHVFVKKYAPDIKKYCGLHKPIELPNFIGMTQEEAVKALENIRLTPNIVFVKSTEAEGLVVGQTPPVDTNVKEGATIILTVSGNEEQTSQNGEGITVPDVAGMTDAQATNSLEGSGFTVVGEYRLSDGKKDTVVGQRPPAGFISQPGSIVTIVINGDSDQVTMPNVKGLSEERAKELLESNGFEVIVNVDDNSANLEKYGAGSVSGQEPSPRVKADRGAEVVLYVTPTN
jgi:penicillin-binding protein 1A